MPGEGTVNVNMKFENKDHKLGTFHSIDLPVKFVFVGPNYMQEFTLLIIHDQIFHEINFRSIFQQAKFSDVQHNVWLTMNC